MKKTKNFNLNQWEPHDEIKVVNFNADNAAVDAALGQCGKIAIGSYVGTGTSGEENLMTLTFDFKPRFIRVLFSSDGAVINFYELTAMEGVGCATIYGNYLNNSFQNKVYLTWGENSISWYSPGDAIYQLNNLDTVYHYMVLG